MIEMCKANIPAGDWVHGEIRVPLKRATCHALLRFGDQTLHMPLRIQHSEDEGIIPATIEGIQAGLTLFVDGSTDCLDRSTDPRSSPRPTGPLEATASWSSGEGEEALELLKALELGPQLCQAQFRCDLSLSGHLSPEVGPEGVQVLRACVAGSLCLRPWFHPSNKTAVVEFYHAAKAWFLQEQDDKARETCEKALKLGDELRPLPVEMADALHLLGAIHLRQKSLPLAVKCFERALVIKKVFENEEEPSDSQLSTLLALGGAQLQSGKASDALGCFQIVSNALEEREDQTVMQAAECLRETLLLWRQTQDGGIGSPKDVAATLHSLGNVYRGLVDAASAHRCFSAALQIREALLGAAHPHTARTRHCLALAGCSLGTPREALEELNLAMDGLLQNLGSKHPWTLQARLDAKTLTSSRPGSAGSQKSMGV